MSTNLILSSEPEVGSLVPAFMQEAGSEGTEQLGQFIRPPRIKVIQPLREGPYEQFEPGDVVLTPTMLKLVSAGEPFHFVPLLFFPEYLTINPIKMKGQLPFIRERSLDPSGTIAMKSRNPEMRFEVCPENTQEKIRHVECLTFIVVIAGVPALMGLPIALSFSKGEYGRGTQFAALIKMRHAPLYGCVFQGVCPAEKRKNQQGSWYGIDVSNPTGDMPPFVMNQDEFLELKKRHQQLKEQQGQIVVEYEEDSELGGEPVAEGEAKF